MLVIRIIGCPATTEIRVHTNEIILINGLLIIVELTLWPEMYCILSHYIEIVIRSFAIIHRGRHLFSVSPKEARIRELRLSVVVEF